MQSPWSAKYAKQAFSLTLNSSDFTLPRLPLLKSYISSVSTWLHNKDYPSSRDISPVLRSKQIQLILHSITVYNYSSKCSDSFQGYYFLLMFSITLQYTKDLLMFSITLQYTKDLLMFSITLQYTRDLLMFSITLQYTKDLLMFSITLQYTKDLLMFSITLQYTKDLLMFSITLQYTKDLLMFSITIQYTKDLDKRR